MPVLEYSRRGPNGGFAMEATIDGTTVVVDPRLIDVLERAAEKFPLRVVAFSGVAGRDTGTPNHPTGRAVDVLIFDEDGTPIPNYNYAPSIPVYEEYAQTARRIQQSLYPELDDLFRWGGYFIRGGADLMHFDVAGPGMAGGSWDGGLEPGRVRDIGNMTDGIVRYTDGRLGTRKFPADEVSSVDARDYFGLPMEFYQRFGDNPLLVAQAQRYLSDNGYYTGTIDGVFGPGTNDAMAQFGAEYGMPIPTPNPNRPAPVAPPIPKPNPLRPDPSAAFRPAPGFTPGTLGFAQSPAMHAGQPVRFVGEVPRPGPVAGSAGIPAATPGFGQAIGAVPGWAELAAGAGGLPAQNAGPVQPPGLGSIVPGAGSGQLAALAAYQPKADAPGGYASLIENTPAKPRGLLDVEAMEEEERNAAQKAARTALRARSADSGAAAKGLAAVPEADPAAPMDSDPIDVWMEKRWAQLRQRGAPRTAASTELSDDLPIEEWMRRRNAQASGRSRPSSSRPSPASSSGSSARKTSDSSSTSSSASSSSSSRKPSSSGSSSSSGAKKGSSSSSSAAKSAKPSSAPAKKPPPKK